MKIRVLLITSYFAPDAHVASNRWSRLSKHLQDECEITVLSGNNQSLSAIFPVAKGLSVSPELKIHRINYSYRGKFKRLALLSPTGLCTILNRLFHLGSSTRWRSWAHFIDRLSRKTYAERTLPDPSWSWGLCAFKFAQKRLSNGSFDLIVASAPLLGCLRAASLLSDAWHGKPWIADIRDPIHNDHQSLLSERHRTVIKTVESKLLNHASRVVTINPQLASMLAVPSSIDIIPNPFEAATLLPMRASAMKRLERGTIRIAYAGSLQNGLLTHPLVEGLKELRDEMADNRLTFDYYGRSDRQFAELIESIQNQDILLNRHPHAEQSTLLQALSGADLLLLFGWNGPGFECVQSGKIFDYIAARRPVIAISKQATAMSDLIDSTGTGKILQNRNEVASFFRDLLANPFDLVQSLEARFNQSEINRYSASAAAEKYVAIFKDVMSGRR